MKRHTFVVLLVCLLTISVIVGFASCEVKEEPCLQCRGTGKCSHCDGTGQDYNTHYYNHNCVACKGSGKCHRCKGTGIYKY